MKMISCTVLDGASQSWLKACHDLGVRVVAPYFLEVEGETASCLAFLPDFGAPNGVVIGAIGPEFETDSHLAELAKKKGMFCSFINPTPFAKREANETDFKDALIDWGYFGLPENRPKWLET